MPNIALATDSLSLRLKSPLWISASNILTTLQLVVISFFKMGKSFSQGLPFLHFCKKYDICNGDGDALTFGFGKIYAVRHNCGNIDFITKM
jgi:hypothetical protein